MALTREQANKTLAELQKYNKDYNINLQYWIGYKKPYFYRTERINSKYEIELAIYYNYNNKLITKVVKNKIEQENEHGKMTQEVERYIDESEQVTRCTVKKLLEQAKKLGEFDLLKCEFNL